MILLLAVAAESEALDARFGEPILPLPHRVELNPDRVALGERLFHDRRLSGDDTLSCASCHNLTTGGVDRLARSVGIGGAEGKINAPTVFNSGLNFRQFWDGRAATLEEQAVGPIHNPVEMGSNWEQVIGKLSVDADYVTAFTRAYPDGLRPANIQDAIATFERSLITPGAPFDRYLRGEPEAISGEAAEGYRLFKAYGCTACHQGAGVGGNMYQKFGLFGDFFADRGGAREHDMGRYNVTGDEEDRYYFKVPSLRNVALTAPYLHDGSVESLDGVVEIMARYQLGRVLPDEDRRRIVAFLKTLTGRYKGEPL